ncbi:uncharacterized protein LOC111604279 [Drosophila hydei]|uniref:Uncharacterized protein LOC111604279 n=1 Tax=Drosophila hydei TaxID=7224 RepID=A0A6J1MFB1_DROHY|nr:uncharacterized protein LOC111604279 [Drosophila hydei]
MDSNKVRLTLPNKLNRALLFRKKPFLKATDRDNGLLPVDSERASTPYPQAHVAIDPNAVEERLNSRDQRRSVVKIQSPSEDELKNIRMHHSLHSTPHPTKGTAVNPRVLRERLKDSTFGSDGLQEKQVSISSKKRSYSSTSSATDLSFGTPHPKKRVVLNAQTLVKRLVKAESVYRLKNAKKVILISPRESTLRLRSTDSSTDSFENRRRQFHMAEFTIAKNGKKMSDFQAQQPDLRRMPKYQVDESYINEIEEYIKIQGLIKSNENELISMKAFPRDADSEYSTETSQLSNEETTTVLDYNVIKPIKHPSILKDSAVNYSQNRSISFDG